MSAIDSFKHEQIAFVRCPMKHSMYRDGRIFNRLPVYRLLEDVWDEISLSGRAGDILIGGGFGEANAVCFSIPAICTYFAGGPDPFEKPPITSHWSVNDAFLFGVGFETLGWNPEKEDLLLWLAGHLVAFLCREYPDEYASHMGKVRPAQDGSIFTTPADLK